MPVPRTPVNKDKKMASVETTKSRNHEEPQSARSSAGDAGYVIGSVGPATETCRTRKSSDGRLPT